MKKIVHYGVYYLVLMWYISSKCFNPQISQITQITMNVGLRMRNLPGLIPRSLLRLDRIYHTLME